MLHDACIILHVQHSASSFVIGLDCISVCAHPSMLIELCSEVSPCILLAT
jgi:hypothetical protein